jgi:hypothetical protein
MAWKPVTFPGRPPAECVNCADLIDAVRPSTWRKTNHAKLKPRCATHQRQVHNAAKANSKQVYQARNFTMSPELHAELLVEQGGVCAVCLYANGRTKALATDHDHSCCNGPTSCGACVRGKLCGPDNQDIVGRIEMIAGRNGERPADVLLRLIAYFEDPPMARTRRRLERISA